MPRHAHRLAGPALLLLAATACTIEHKVADDYAQYLENNEGQRTFAATGLRAAYTLTEDTDQHRLEFRSWMAGYANLWIVEFGKILDATLQSEDVRAAFAELERADPSAAADLLTFSVEDYVFEDTSAQVTLHVSFTSDGASVLDQSYTARGKSQGGKMFWGGAFAMKNAIQQSTKLAMDDILAELTDDLAARGAPSIAP